MSRARGAWTIISARDGKPMTFYSNEISGDIGVPEGSVAVPGATCVCHPNETGIVMVDPYGFKWCNLSGNRVYGPVESD